MALEAFRRHQKKMLAVLALLAMVAFTLNLGQFGRGGRGPMRDTVVFKVGNTDVNSGDLRDVILHRVRANRFLAAVTRDPSAAFGGTSDLEIRQAYLLQREADRLGIPATPELANKWLQANFPTLTREQFDRIYTENFTEGELSCTDTQLLTDVAEQIRLAALQRLPIGVDAESNAMMRFMGPGRYLITPLDVYDAYRDENQRISVIAVPVAVDTFVSQVGQPSEADLEAFYNKYKDQLPDSNRDTPGFKVPAKAQVEYVMIDADGLYDKYRDALTEAEVKTHYDEHKDEFPPPPKSPFDLPQNLFAGDPDAKLTPRTQDDFSQVRDTVRSTIARQKADDEVESQFNQIRSDVMEPFLAKYDQALEAQREASETKQAPPPLPEPIDPKTKASLLKQKADALALNYVMTPLMTREEADRLLPIGSAHEGTQRLSDTPSFAEHFFDERSNQYEPTEFIDAGGTRYLAWKFAQQAEYIPTLDDIRPQVADAWKRDKARGLAEKEAKQLAEAAKKSGDLKAAAGDRLVLTTADITKLVPPLDPRIGTVRDSEIAEIPNAGKALRDAFFSLQPGEIKVEANAPKTTYYVLALNRRSDVDLKRLFSPFGERIRLQQRVGNLAFLERQERWTDYLLQQAGPVQVIVPPREDRGDEGE